MALLILPDKNDAKGEWQVEFRVIWEIEIEADSPKEAAPRSAGDPTDTGHVGDRL